MHIGARPKRLAGRARTREPFSTGHGSHSPNPSQPFSTRALYPVLLIPISCDLSLVFFFLSFAFCLARSFFHLFLPLRRPPPPVSGITDGRMASRPCVDSQLPKSAGACHTASIISFVISFAHFHSVSTPTCPHNWATLTHNARKTLFYYSFFITHVLFFHVSGIYDALHWVGIDRTTASSY